MTSGVIQQRSGPELRQALAELSRQLSVGAGIVSPASLELTRKVFGKPLQPGEVVKRILKDVRERGDEAVREYTLKLQGADLDPSRFRVSEEEMAKARAEAPAALMDAVAKAAENVRAYQSHFLPPPVPAFEPRPGVRLDMRVRPLDRVGMCIPGGKAPYPSSIVMIAVPAQVAGVPRICMITPCGRDGAAPGAALATAWELGVREVYRVGGAHGVAALAYGTQSIPRVDKIAGPGNIYVALAKREVYGVVDIDMVAGPSEILIVADDSADPVFCAADLLSQAEHDPAACVLLTPCARLAQDVAAEVAKQLTRLSRAGAAGECVRRYGLIGVTESLDECVELADSFAPEHLEVMTRDAESLAGRFANYGCVFVGPWSTEPAGDYVAGPSHVLPTGGTSRFFSALSAHDFLKRSSVVHFSRQALLDAAPAIREIALAEGFDAHANAAMTRTR
ncbi:MAG TPA: histidinol dehydrogenase [Candidatus Brocadiia bacterium]|nr:histidinol dehydrogenase [Candidatus Brocadiia bacterium]